MNLPIHEPTDAQLLTDLQRMWELADPMPGDLPERVLFALDLEELDMDFELLRLVSTAQEDLSVRSVSSDVNTITFSGSSVTVMVRISELSGSRRRLDGWLAWTTPLRVVIHHSEGTYEAEVDERGRFVAGDIPAGMTRFVLTPADDEQATPCITPTVEI